MKSRLYFLPVLLALGLNSVAADAPPAPATLDQLLPLLSDTSAQCSEWEDALQKLAATAARPGANVQRAGFAQSLCAKASDTGLSLYQRTLLLRQLAVVTGPECVPALTALLADANLQIREYARRTLAATPGPEAEAVLLDALKKGGDTPWKIGLMNALGCRRDCRAVTAITAGIANPATSKAASLALAKIATPAAVAAIESASPVDADALAQAAERLAHDGQNARAAAVAVKVLSGNAPVQARAVALTALAATDRDQAKKWIPRTLADSNPRLQAVAISAVFTVDGIDGATAALAAQLPRLKPAAALAFLRLADASAEPAAISLLDSPDTDVQEGAMTALGRFGSAAAVPALLKLAGNAPRENTSIVTALSVINGPGAEEALRNAAANLKADSKSRALAISVLGWRANKSAGRELVAYASEPDSAISRAACVALKSVGSDAELMPMLKLVMSGAVPNAASAVRAIAARSNSRQQCVPEILTLGRDLHGKALVPMLEALSLIGGPEALRAVVGYTESNQPEVVEGAVHALCQWPELEAVAPLLKIGTDAKLPETLRIRALRSTERIILSAEDDSPQDRVNAAVGLLHAASRNEEKGLAMSVIASIPNGAAATSMLTLIRDKDLASLACPASLNLAELLIHKRRGDAANLAKAVIEAKPEAAVATRAQSILDKAVERN